MIDGEREAGGGRDHLCTGLVLPRRVGGEEHDGPSEEKSGGLVACEEEGLALVHQKLQVEVEAGRPLLGLGEEQPEEVIAVGDTPADVDAVLPALYHLH